MICFSWYISWRFIQLLYFSNTIQILSKAVGDKITLIYALYYLGFNTSHSNYDGLIQYKPVTSLKLESYKNFTVIFKLIIVYKDANIKRIISISYTTESSIA